MPRSRHKPSYNCLVRAHTTATYSCSFLCITSLHTSPNAPVLQQSNIYYQGAFKSPNSNNLHLNLSSTKSYILLNTPSITLLINQITNILHNAPKGLHIKQGAKTIKSMHSVNLLAGKGLVIILAELSLVLIFTKPSLLFSTSFRMKSNLMSMCLVLLWNVF